MSKPNSVISKLSLEGIAKKNNDPFPVEIHPALATLVTTIPDSANWLYEIKFDGYRMITFINGKNINLITRNQLDWSKKFPYLVRSLQKLALENAILDGEIVALNAEQHSDFQLLQNSIHNKDTSKLIYYVFDLIYYNGKNLMAIPLIERKLLLNQIITSQTNTIRYSEHVIGNGSKLFKKACQLHLEGMVAKKADSPYLQKRSTNWLKVKCSQRQEFIVVGFTQPTGTRRYFRSLLLAVYSKQKTLVFCGHVGTGFTATTLKNLYEVLKKQLTTTRPLSAIPASNGKITWVKPVVVVEVEFSEWTKEGLLRHPSFKGVRKDKNPKEIIHEKPKTL